MNNPATCYRCPAPATSREHFPPKAFFPKGGNLQLKTVPSCMAHNGDKSRDDQYLLTHICLHAGREDNLAARVFRRSIVPGLQRSPAFRALMNEGAEWLEAGSRRYPVDIARFDGFFDNLVHAILFDRFGRPLPDDTHSVRHVYVSLTSEDEFFRMEVDLAKAMTGSFFDAHAAMVDRFEADRIDEAVYANTIAAPLGLDGSITVAHVFYGIFEVVSFVTHRSIGQEVATWGEKLDQA